MFIREIALAMVEEIVQGPPLDAATIARRIIEAVPAYALDGPGFSEYGTYGNYVYLHARDFGNIGDTSARGSDMNQLSLSETILCI
jgi:hypothetical protein